MDDHQKAAAVLVILAWASLISVYISRGTLSILAALLFPLAFTYTASMSFKEFRRESLGSLAVLPGVFLGPKVLVVSLTIALGCPWVSYQARNIYNGRNEFYTLYKAPSIAILLLGIIVTGSLVHAYHTDAGVRDKVMDRAVESFLRFSYMTGGSLERAQRQRVDFARNLSAYSVQRTGAVLSDEIQSSGTDFSSEQIAVLNEGLQRAEDEIPAAVARKLEAGGKVSTEELRPLLEEQLRPLLVPSTWLYLIIFATVMSGVWIIQMPFGLLCALYGRFVFRRAPFQRIYGGD